MGVGADGCERGHGRPMSGSAEKEATGRWPVEEDKPRGKEGWKKDKERAASSRARGLWEESPVSPLFMGLTDWDYGK